MVFRKSTGNRNKKSKSKNEQSGVLRSTNFAIMNKIFETDPSFYVR